MHNNSHSVVLLGLVGLMVAMPWWVYVSTASLDLLWVLLLGALIPALLIYSSLKKIRNWSGIAALCMIPFACIGIMDIVANSGSFNAGTVVAIVSVITFFAALDAGRRDPMQ